MRVHESWECLCRLRREVAQARNKFYHPENYQREIWDEEYAQAFDCGVSDNRPLIKFSPDQLERLKEIDRKEKIRNTQLQIKWNIGKQSH